METLKKHFETINRQSSVETLSKLRQSLGPLWAHKDPILVKNFIILMKNNKIINKNINSVTLIILEVKTWFGDKDL